MFFSRANASFLFFLRPESSFFLFLGVGFYYTFFTTRGVVVCIIFQD